MDLPVAFDDLDAGKDHKDRKLSLTPLKLLDRGVSSFRMMPNSSYHCNQSVDDASPMPWDRFLQLSFSSSSSEKPIRLPYRSKWRRVNEIMERAKAAQETRTRIEHHSVSDEPSININDQVQSFEARMKSVQERVGRKS